MVPPAARLTPVSEARASDTAASAFTSNSYFTALDGLRGVSILLVLFHHVPRTSLPIVSTLQQNGCYGVSLFFVISGFLICTLLLRDEQKQGRVSLGNFYARRALRLLPLYYAVLAAQAFLVYGMAQHSPENKALFADKLPSYLFYYSNWLPNSTQGPFFCVWSLAVEEQFYLGFGLLLVFLPRRVLVALTLMALGTKFVVFQFIGTVDEWFAPLRVVFSYQEAILWGVLLAFATHSPAVRAKLLKTGIASRGAGLAVTGFILLWLLFHDLPSSSRWDAELLYLCLTLLVAHLVFHRDTRGLSRGPVAYVGRISYGIYLLHMFVISAVKKLPMGQDPLLCLLLTAAIVIPLAALVYRHFERPIIAFYKRRFSDDRDSARSVGGLLIPSREAPSA